MIVDKANEVSKAVNREIKRLLVKVKLRLS